LSWLVAGRGELAVGVSGELEGGRREVREMRSEEGGRRRRERRQLEAGGRGGEALKSEKKAHLE
jgi:hypothetical protein